LIGIFKNLHQSLKSKLERGTSSGIIIRIVQQVFYENDFVDVDCFVKNLASRFNSHAFQQGKGAVDGGRPCVTSNICTVRESLKIEINTEIGVVPVVDTVPVSHKEPLAGFHLVLAVAWKGEWSIQVELDVFRLLEIAGGL